MTAVLHHPLDGGYCSGLGQVVLKARRRGPLTCRHKGSPLSRPGRARSPLGGKHGRQTTPACHVNHGNTSRISRRSLLKWL